MSEPLAQAPTRSDVPLAELAYAPVSERVAVRPVLSVVMTMPIALVIYDITNMAAIVYQLNSGGTLGVLFTGSSIILISIEMLRAAAGLVMIAVAAAGRRTERLRPTMRMCGIYAAILTLAACVHTAFQGTIYGSYPLDLVFRIQMFITSLAPVITPAVCFFVLGRLCRAISEER